MSGETGELLILALVAELKIRYRADPETRNVDVRYADVGQPTRERVYGGGSRADLQYAAYASGTPRNPRDEEGTVEMHVDVIRMGWTVEQADARARLLTGVLERTCAESITWNLRASPQPVPLMSWCRFASVERDYFALDNGEVWSTRGITIAYRARLH